MNKKMPNKKRVRETLIMNEKRPNNFTARETFIKEAAFKPYDLETFRVYYSDYQI